MGIKRSYVKRAYLQLQFCIFAPGCCGPKQDPILYYNKGSALHSPHAVPLYCSQALFIDCERTYLFPLVTHIFSLPSHLFFLPSIWHFFLPFPPSLSTFPLQGCSNNPVSFLHPISKPTPACAISLMTSSRKLKSCLQWKHRSGQPAIRTLLDHSRKSQ